MKDAADPAANHAARLVLRASPSASPSRGPLSEVSKKHDFKYTRNDIITTAEPFPLSHVPRRRAWERLPRQLNTPGKCTRKIWKRYIPRVSAQPLAREQEGEFGSPGSKAIKNLCSAEAAGRPGFTKKRLGIAAQWKRRRSGLPHKYIREARTRSSLQTIEGIRESYYDGGEVGRNRGRPIPLADPLNIIDELTHSRPESGEVEKSEHILDMASTINAPTNSGPSARTLGSNLGLQHQVRPRKYNITNGATSMPLQEQQIQIMTLAGRAKRPRESSNPSGTTNSMIWSTTTPSRSVKRARRTSPIKMVQGDTPWPLPDEIMAQVLAPSARNAIGLSTRDDDSLPCRVSPITGQHVDVEHVSPSETNKSSRSKHVAAVEETRKDIVKISTANWSFESQLCLAELSQDTPTTPGNSANMTATPDNCEEEDVMPSKRVLADGRDSPDSTITTSRREPLSRASCENPPIDAKTDVLIQFLHRANASKAARIAKTSSLSHRRDSSAVKQALASPAKVLDELDAASPGPLCISDDRGAATGEIVTLTAIDVEAAESAQSVEAATPARIPLRRSTRSQMRPAPDSATQVMSVRPTGTRRVVLAKDARALATTTQANTRRNKAGASSAAARLIDLRTAPPPMDHEAGSTDDLTLGEGLRGTRGIRWDAQIAHFFVETRLSADEEAADDKPMLVPMRAAKPGRSALRLPELSVHRPKPETKKAPAKSAARSIETLDGATDERRDESDWESTRVAESRPDTRQKQQISTLRRIRTPAKRMAEVTEDEANKENETMLSKLLAANKKPKLDAGQHDRRFRVPRKAALSQ